MAGTLRVLLTLGLLLASAACAVAEPSSPTSPSPTSPSSTTPTASAAPTGDSRLTIVVDDGTGATTSWTLTCDPAGGSHPDAERACAALDAHRSALSPVPEGRMCAQVYGGPERATITGTWRGEPVSATLVRTDACETARWDALVPLVPAGGQ
jgi:hypothetical protein